MNSQQRRKFRRKYRHCVVVPWDRLFEATVWCAEHYTTKQYSRSHLAQWPIGMSSNAIAFDSAETAMDFTMRWL